MSQVVIQRELDGRYLARKGSYKKTTWTEDLDEAQTFGELGAKRCIESIRERYWDKGVMRTDNKFNTRPVRISFAPSIVEMPKVDVEMPKVDVEMPKVEIEKTLVLSTGHLTQEAAEWLDDGATHNTCWVVDVVSYGWLLRTTPLVPGLNIKHQCLQDCIAFARKHECDWIRFDADGRDEDDLPLYDWP